MVVIAISAIASLEFFKYCYGNFIIPAKWRLEAINYARGSIEAVYMEEYGSPALGDTEGWVELPDPGGDLAGLGAGSDIKVYTKNSPAGQEYKVVSTRVTWTP